MRIRRHRRWLALLALFAATSAAAQQAQSPFCASLSAQLTALDQSVGQQNQGLTNQYQLQSAALQVMQAQAAQQGCLVLFRAFAPPQCGPILFQLDQLRASVAQLERSIRTANNNGASGQRNAILRTMQLNGCTYQPPQPRQASYRTLCVRTCDGYYFPIAFATTRDHFEDNRAACQAQCPGQEVDLYYHRNPGETIDEAVNLDGTAYAAMANAFGFRQAYNPDCRCGTPAAIEVAGVGGPFTPLPEPVTDRLADLRAIVPMPAARPEPTEDPETLANRAGGLTLPYDPFHGAPAMALEIDGVRIVGPAFYAAR